MERLKEMVGVLATAFVVAAFIVLSLFAMGAFGSEVIPEVLSDKMAVAESSSSSFSPKAARSRRSFGAKGQVSTHEISTGVSLPSSLHPEGGAFYPDISTAKKVATDTKTDMKIISPRGLLGRIVFVCIRRTRTITQKRDAARMYTHSM